MNPLGAKTMPSPINYFEIIKKNTTTVENQFQKKNFQRNIFNEPVIAVDFQESILSQASFNAPVSDCNFINTQLDQAKFMKSVTGFTCFSGANLNETLFSNPCENTVIFIGAHLPEQNKPLGGIQTVAEFKIALDENKYTIEQIRKLDAMLTLAHAQVSKALITYAHVPYHINENYLDHLNQAKRLLEHYNLPRRTMTAN